MYHYNQISISNTHYIILLEVTMNLIEESLSVPIQKCKYRMDGQKWLCILIILYIWQVPLATFFWQILLNFDWPHIVIVTAVLAGLMAEPAKENSSFLAVQTVETSRYFIILVMYSIFIPKKTTSDFFPSLTQVAC